MKNEVKTIIIFLYISIFFSSCIGYGFEKYPNILANRVEQSPCPNISGLYKIEGKFLRDDSTQTSRTSSLFDSELPSDHYAEYIQIQQRTCSDIYLSLYNSNGLIEHSDSGLRLECLKISLNNFTSNYLEVKPYIPSGGSSFMLGIPESNYDRIFHTEKGEIVINRIHSLCGIVLIPPFPICYYGSLSNWKVYEQVVIDKLIDKSCFNRAVSD